MIMAGRAVFWTLAGLAGLAVVLMGCATVQTSKYENTEQLLSAAGFHLKLADTPARQAKLKAMMQYTIVPHDRNGKIFYVYADAANNRLFIGDQRAYQQYEALAVEKQIAQDQVTAAALNADATMDWEMWGPDPWW
jgi:hypothetical protein